MPIPSFLRLAAAASIAYMCAGAPANAGQIFNLTVSNVSFDIPSPLFTSSQIDGFLVIADSIGPGGSFGAGQLESFAFNIAGFSFTQADLDPNFSSIDVNGQISADGLSIPFLQIGYSLDPLFPGCSFVCAGAFNIAQSAQSNFVVADDPDAETLGLVLFDAAFDKVAVQVPEPVTLSLFAIGLVGAGALRRRQKQA